MTEPPPFGRAVLGATPGDVVAAEVATGRHERFAPVDGLVGALLTAAFSGREIVGAGLSTVVEGQDQLLADVFAVASQQARGAWWLPDDASLKAGLLNLPAHLLAGRRFSYGMARDEQFKAVLAERPDWVAVWAVLQPLFAILLAPIEMRSQKAGTVAPKEAMKAWAAVDQAFVDLGVDVTDDTAVLRYGSGWSKLRAEEQRRAKVAFAQSLASQVGIDTARRFRALRTSELVDKYYAKAKREPPTQRQVVSRSLGQVLAGHFGGDWLAFLAYLGEAPATGEQITTVLPKARLYVVGSDRVQAVAEAKGLAPEVVEAMLASFYGEGSLRSPVEHRVETLRRCWAELDAAHAAQEPGMRPLGASYERDLRRFMLSTEVLAEIDSLWDGKCLPRWPGRIVSTTDPLLAMSVAFGPALRFWHQLGINTWSLTEGPYTPNSLEGVGGLAEFHRAEVTALAEAGTPIPPALFHDLSAAEKRLGPPVEVTNELSRHEVVPGISLTVSTGAGTRRAGFTVLRDIVSAYRQRWAGEHLEPYLRWRWESELRHVAWEHSRWLAAKGKAPTLGQFAKMAAPAANNWFGGDIGDLFGAFGETPPAPTERVRLMPANRQEFRRLVWEGLGGEKVEEEASWREPERAELQWAIQRLADEAAGYVQLQEALGVAPGPKELFGHRKWPEGTEALWPRYVEVVERSRVAALSLPPAPARARPPARPAAAALGADQRPAETQDRPAPAEPDRRSLFDRFRRKG